MISRRACGASWALAWHRAPAAAAQHDYARNLVAARELLDGHDISLLDQHQQLMLEAAQRQEYERAAAYRDNWESLQLLHDQLAILRSGQRDCWFVYPFAKPTDGRTAGSMKLVDRDRGTCRGPLFRNLARPRRLSASPHCWKSVVRDHRLTRPDDVAQLRLVAGWFRQHPDDRAATLSIEQAQARCRELAAGTTP